MPRIGYRYDVLDELGRSEVGVVYLAADRLTGERVALKVVTAELLETRLAAMRAAQTPGTPSFEIYQSRVLLSRLLLRLASLRHPHIVSVLDFGFDEGLRPFYTRELMHKPRCLLEAASERPFEDRFSLLIEILQALSYLHRRGIVHGDLAPPTVLVEAGRIRLADFGISALSVPGETPSAARSPYLAPELLLAAPPSVASDLYAFGMLAYRVLTERELQPDGEAGPPAISTSDLDARLIPVLGRLLATDPGERYGEAEEVVAALSAALGRPLPEETVAIRESFLRTARVAGRDPEIQQLTSLLAAMVAGQGSALLIGGESGAGKSRLLEELRTLSLARGALVLRGQAIGEGFDPYQPWREVLRQLCLVVPLDDDQAVWLKTQVPDLENLIGARAVAAVPESPDPQVAQKQLRSAVERLFRALEQPCVLILDDLHWAQSASLALLEHLIGVADERALLIVGAFRDDERPDLPRILDRVPLLKLGRLDRAGVAELAGSMLGRRGTDPALVDFLEQQTGGNALFLVEVVRSLAQSAGRLDHIDPSRLPEQVSTGGIRQIVQQRLDRVPRRMRPLLRLAAVAGRDLDLDLLAALEPGFQPELWLRFGSDLALFEVVGGRFRFAHDRLREALLSDLPAAERRAAHRRIAEALTAVHGRSEDQVPTLAYHWTRAADLSDPEATGRAVDYLERAGDVATAACATEEAERLLNQALALVGTLPSAGERGRYETRLQICLGTNLLMSRGYTAPEVGYAFGRARSLAEGTGDAEQLLSAMVGLWRFYIARGELEVGHRLAEEMRVRAEQVGDGAHRVIAEYAMGNTLWMRGLPARAAPHLQAAIDLESAERAAAKAARPSISRLGQHPGVLALGYASLVHWCLGYPEHSEALSRRSLRLAAELEHPFARAFALTAKAWLAQLRGDPEVCLDSALAAAALCREQGFPTFQIWNRAWTGWGRARTGQVAAGLAEIRSALDECRAAGAEILRPYFLALLAEAYGVAERFGDAATAFEQAAGDADRYGGGWWLAEIHRQWGELYLRLPKPNVEASVEHFQQAVAAAESRGEKLLTLRALISWVQLRSGDGRPARRATRALADLRALFETFSEGFESADLSRARVLLAAAGD